jgi:hypothetical protein
LVLVLVLLPKAWEFGLPTIWREAPANPANAMPLTHRAARFTAGTRRVVSKLDSYGLRPESTAGGAIAIQLDRLCPQGVGVRLADDLPGTGSKTMRTGRVRRTAFTGFAGAALVSFVQYPAATTF